jgi:hypothetical protein
MRGVAVAIGFAWLLCAALLTGCGENATTVAPGQPVTLTGGQSVKVPAGATIRVSGNITVSGDKNNLSFDGAVVTISGHDNIVMTSAGAVVSVPDGATGPADNTVTAKK